MEGANDNSNGTTTPRAVPPLLADVEVSNLPGFDVTPTPSPRPQPSPKKAPRPGVSGLPCLSTYLRGSDRAHAGQLMVIARG